MRILDNLFFCAMLRKHFISLLQKCKLKLLQLSKTKFIIFFTNQDYLILTFFQQVTLIAFILCGLQSS